MAPAVAAAVVTTGNADEVNQVAGVKSYLASKFASVPAATGIVLRASGQSGPSGISLNIQAQVVTIT